MNNEIKLEVQIERAEFEAEMKVNFAEEARMRLFNELESVAKWAKEAADSVAGGHAFGVREMSELFRLKERLAINDALAQESINKLEDLSAEAVDRVLETVPRGAEFIEAAKKVR